MSENTIEVSTHVGKYDFANPDEKQLSIWIRILEVCNVRITLDPEDNEDLEDESLPWDELIQESCKRWLKKIWISTQEDKVKELLKWIGIKENADRVFLEWCDKQMVSLREQQLSVTEQLGDLEKRKLEVLKKKLCLPIERMPNKPKNHDG